jgi:CBS-domain-containing membrane protein
LVTVSLPAQPASFVIPQNTSHYDILISFPVLLASRSFCIAIMANGTTKSWFELGPGGHAEKLISGIAAFFGILCVLAVSSLVLSDAELPLVVASMGASAVLLFAVPHGPLSQPWPLLGSHALSALIGVTVARFCHSPLLASALAVGLAIVAMYYLGCIHPPGGATALTAVLGGTQVCT